MNGRTAAPFPPTSLSGEGPEGGVAAVSALLASAGVPGRLAASPDAVGENKHPGFE